MSLTSLIFMVVETSSLEQTGITTGRLGIKCSGLLVNPLRMVYVFKSVLKDRYLPGGFLAEFVSS